MNFRKEKPGRERGVMQSPAEEDREVVGPEGEWGTTGEGKAGGNF